MCDELVEQRFSSELCEPGTRIFTISGNTLYVSLQMPLLYSRWKRANIKDKDCFSRAMSKQVCSWRTKILTTVRDMQICQGTAEINGITLHYNSTKNLTLCRYKFTGRFIKINLYVHIHHTRPVDWFVWIQLPAIKAHSSSVCVAAGLSTHLWYLMQQHARRTKSVLTLLFHKRKRLRYQNSIQEQFLQFC